MLFQLLENPNCSSRSEICNAQKFCPETDLREKKLRKNIVKPIAPGSALHDDKTTRA